MKELGREDDVSFVVRTQANLSEQDDKVVYITLTAFALR